ncbi:MAG: hypothetical protein IJ461_08815 [Clostridia bacterium]|nr:hypothetical protein [Clostridia bacterium]
MKKLFAWLLTAMLVWMPLAALAYESPMDEAYEAGALLTTQVYVTPGTLPGEGETAQVLFTDLLNALKVETTSQKNANGAVDTFALKMQGEDALTFKTVEKNGMIYLTSSMLGNQVVTLNAETADQDLMRLLTLLNEQMGGTGVNFTLNGVDMEQKAMENALIEMAQKVANSVGSRIQALAARAQTSQETVTSDLHDTADTVARLTMTCEDLAGLWDAVVDGLLSAEAFTATLIQQGITADDGTTYTGQQALDYYDGQMRQLSEMIRSLGQEFEVTYWYGGGEIVAIRMTGKAAALTPEEKAAAQVNQMLASFGVEEQTEMVAPQLPDGQDFTYYRKTADAAVTHTLDWTITADGETVRMNGLFTDSGEEVSARLTIDLDVSTIRLAYLRNAQGFTASISNGLETYSLIFTKEDAESSLYWNLKVTGSDGAAETEYLSLIYDAQGFGMGNVAQEKISLELSLMGQSLATLHVDRSATQEEALPTFVSLGDMTDEQLTQWTQEALSTAATSLFGLTQKLPDSVMFALFGY